MTEAAPQSHDEARDGTLYWTVSLYVSAEDLAGVYPATYQTNPGKALRSAQLKHFPSLALRNAIDPLFNDVADRDYFGRPRDFLFAAGLGQTNSVGQKWTLGTAGNALLGELEIETKIPASFRWSTEGIEFHCNLGECEPRKLKLRRFWFAHSDGALSYHLSFEHHYGSLPNAYGVETYFFFSLLQKLAAPKEFMLSDELLHRLINAEYAECVDPLSEPGKLGIDPLDLLTLHTNEKPDGQTFWNFVQDLFSADARILLTDVLHIPAAAIPRDPASLLRLAEVIEVPGLRLPRCRYLFHVDDRRFFNHLLPLDPVSGESLPRKNMVRDQCFAPYREMIRGLSRKNGKAASAVYLGKPAADATPSEYLEWNQLDLTVKYELWLKSGVFQDERKQQIIAEPVLRAALHSGTARLCVDGDGNPCEPMPLHIPAYQTGRSDCLDYLFLAGFNQNIIDWLNQDTSEVLDSIDPIYPTEDVQADERFFVRYANHRGMITYVAGSRSLEIGNDYLGTCPYAFLIHVLAMHNEFLARDHEQRSDEMIERIDQSIEELRNAGPAGSEEEGSSILARSRQIEQEINDLKRDSYRKYERHRYLNIFRYDTESVVFSKLAKLRGTNWRGEAMERALATLEEYAADLDRRQAEAVADSRREQGTRLGALVGAVGLISSVGVLFNLADYFSKHPWRWPPRGRGSGETLGSYVFGNAAWLIATAGLLVVVALVVVHRNDIFRAFSKWFNPRGNGRE